MALFYILSIRGQRNNNMRCSIHSMPRQTLWVSHCYILSLILRPISEGAFRSHLENARSRPLESFMNFVYKKNKTRSLISNDSKQFTPHVLWKKKPPR